MIIFIWSKIYISHELKQSLRPIMSDFLPFLAEKTRMWNITEV